MKLRTAILVAVLSLIAGILTAAVVAVGAVIGGSAAELAHERVDRALELFRHLARDRQLLRASETRVVAEEPRLRAAVATEDPSRATVVDVAREMRRTVASDLFLLTDARGRLVVDVLEPEASGYDYTRHPEVAAALEVGAGGGVWTDESRAFLVQARRVTVGDRAVGVLVVGHAFERELVERIEEETGTAAAIVLDGRALVASRFGGEIAAAQIEAVLPEVAGAREQAVEVRIAGTRYLARSEPVDGYSGERTLYWAVFEDLDRALAPGRRMTRVIYAIAVCSILAAMMLAAAFARRLTRPLENLVEFTRTVARGELRERAAVAGPEEVAQLGHAMNKMVRELDESRRSMAEKERLEKELEIAARIQTSILPRRFQVEGLDVAARMEPASEVGGDYFDVLPVPGGAWIGIGDVSGHGLDSGLVMLMAQTGVASLVEAMPEASPRGLLIALNRVVYENVNVRLGRGGQMTLSLLRYYREGRVVIAGAHLDLLLLRAATRRCEVVPTPGTWIGLVDEVGRHTVETELDLEDGDAMVLYTDGVVEAAGEDGAMFGFDRLRATVEECAGRSSVELRDHILSRVRHFRVRQEDDVSVLVFRYRAGEGRETREAR